MFLSFDTGTQAGTSGKLFTQAKLHPTQLFVFNTWDNLKQLYYLAQENKKKKEKKEKEFIYKHLFPKPENASVLSEH